jgi:hypothetical protein
VDDLFLPGNNYDDVTVINDCEPSPPDLPPASYTNGRTAISNSNAEGHTMASTDVETPTSEMVAGWAALHTACLAIEKWIQPLGPGSGWALKFCEGHDLAHSTARWHWGPVPEYRWIEFRCYCVTLILMEFPPCQDGLLSFMIS